jgi:hypothetical protein
MPTEPTNRQSHLFTLRLWTENLDEDEVEWRGRLHYVETDEVRYFSDWASLIPVLLNMLREAQGEETAGIAPGEE